MVRTIVLGLGSVMSFGFDQASLICTMFALMRIT